MRIAMKYSNLLLFVRSFVRQAPQPYNFGYQIDDGYGNNQHQAEEGDSYGNKKGSYGFTDAYGIYRKVDYIADELGFRAVSVCNLFITTLA